MSKQRMIVDTALSIVLEQGSEFYHDYWHVCCLDELGHTYILKVKLDLMLLS